MKIGMPEQGAKENVGRMGTTRRRSIAKRRMGRVDWFTTMWMFVAIVIVLLALFTDGQVPPQAWWSAIHVVTLGVLTNAILQWSWHFARSLLRLSGANTRQRTAQSARQILFNLLLMVLFGGMWAGSAPVVIAAAAGVAIVVGWHGFAMLWEGRTKLGSRFKIIISYYLVSAGFLLLGTIVGGIVATAMLDPNRYGLDDWRVPLTQAHLVLNVFGWVGLTIAGTLVTLGPTMLRTRMAPNSVGDAVTALPVAVVALLAGSALAIVGQTILVGVSLLIYLAALVWGVGLPLVAEARAKSPRSYPTWSVTAGLLWMVVGSAWYALALIFEGPNVSTSGLVATVGVGGFLAVFVGALSYLMPVVVGGGPKALKEGIKVLDRWAIPRLAVRNTLVFAAVFAPSAVAVVIWAVVVATYGTDVYLFALAGSTQAKAKRSIANQSRGGNR